MSQAICQTFSYNEPFDWKSHLAFLAYRSIPGVEIVKGTSYARTIIMDGRQGHFTAEFEDCSNQINIEIHYPELLQLHRITNRIRSIFDLDANSAQIDEFLGKDKILKSVVEKHPGLRVPGCWSGFELAVRAVLGQQVTVKAASTLVSRIVERYGEPYLCAITGLNYVFPEPHKLMRAKFKNIGIVRQRVEAIRSIARLVASENLVIDNSVDSKEFIEEIRKVKGIGEWTASYIAMRALSDANAFPYSDLILCRAVTNEELSPKQLQGISESWQPRRAYAAMLLWKNYGFQRGNDHKI